MSSRGLARLCLALLIVSCAGPPARSPVGGQSLDFAAAWAQAAQAGPTVDACLSIVDEAARHPDAPHALDALEAAADALATRKTSAFEKVSEHHALAFTEKGAIDRILARLSGAYERATAGPFARIVIADRAYRLALHRGDPALAALWRTRTGCVREAVVVGPLDFTPVTSVSRPTPVETGKLAAAYPGIPPFAPRVRAVAVQGDGCDLPLLTTSVLEGLRAVAVDVDVKRADTIGVVLESASPAVLVAGGKVVLVRRYDLGGASVRRLARLTVGPGRLRLVARVGYGGEDTRIRLSVSGGDGMPLATHAPALGDAGTVVPTAAVEVEPRLEASGDAERTLVASAALARQDARLAEHLLEGRATSTDASPQLLLTYAQSIEAAQDLPDNRVIERARAAYETVLASRPTSWEALLGHAQLTAQRRSRAEGRVEAIAELTAARPRGTPPGPMLSAYVAALAAEGRLDDIAERALDDLERAAKGSPIHAVVEDLVHPSVGAERVRRACELDGRDRDGFACIDARVAQGDRKGALSEIARMRALRGSPTALLSLELAQHVALGDAASALRVYDAMRPAERSLAALGLALAASPAALRSRIAADLGSATDSPGSLAPLYTYLLESPAAALEAQARALVLMDLRAPRMTSAATAVLKHVERYTIGETGLLRYTLFDVRRVSGTTDVDQGVQALGALVEGRDVRRTLRQRIHKPDGRVLEPDHDSYAAQGHAELSQLEKGDYIEQIVDGWALPGPSGQLVVDTPDLMPERTSVADATIEIRRPAGLALSMWSHVLLGKSVERLDGDQRVTTYRVTGTEPRRIEEGVPKMDREVAVSFGTSSWAIVARAIAEAIAALDDHDPFVAAWAKKVAASAPGADERTIIIGSFGPPEKR